MPNINYYDTDVGELFQIPLNSRYQEFSVSEPSKSNGDYITYALKGYNEEGPFDIRKRYSDFLKLRVVLIQRWPGFYMPSLPPKKTIGNMDNEFVAIRMEHLDNFIKMLAQYDFLIQSFEFKIFCKYSNDELETQYKALLDESPNKIYEKYQNIY